MKIMGFSISRRTLKGATARRRTNFTKSSYATEGATSGTPRRKSDWIRSELSESSLVSYVHVVWWKSFAYVFFFKVTLIAFRFAFEIKIDTYRFT